MYNLAQPAAGQKPWYGYGAYVDLDIRYHFGVEANFHQLSGSDPTEYERTFQVGPRFVFPVKQRLVLYAKVLVGRGMFNFAALDANGKSYQLANIGYNTQSAGAGSTCGFGRGSTFGCSTTNINCGTSFRPISCNRRCSRSGLRTTSTGRFRAAASSCR